MRTITRQIYSLDAVSIKIKSIDYALRFAKLEELRAISEDAKSKGCSSESKKCDAFSQVPNEDTVLDIFNDSFKTLKIHGQQLPHLDWNQRTSPLATAVTRSNTAGFLLVEILEKHCV